jgi:hypothetical protein
VLGRIARETNNCCVVARCTSKPDLLVQNMNDINRFGGDGVLKGNDK